MVKKKSKKINKNGKEVLSYTKRKKYKNTYRRLLLDEYDVISKNIVYKLLELVIIKRYGWEIFVSIKRSVQEEI
jgi:hypothetical protein